jgi:hypothetical protein
MKPSQPKVTIHFMNLICSSSPDVILIRYCRCRMRVLCRILKAFSGAHERNVLLQM